MIVFSLFGPGALFAEEVTLSTSSLDGSLPPAPVVSFDPLTGIFISKDSTGVTSSLCDANGHCVLEMSGGVSPLSTLEYNYDGKNISDMMISENGTIRRIVSEYDGINNTWVFYMEEDPGMRMEFHFNPESGNFEFCPGCMPDFCQQFPDLCAPPPPPSTCGDGIFHPDYEQCDPTVLESIPPGYTCNYYCQLEPILCEPGSGITVCFPTSCGNGSLDAGEECDDGNQLNGDGCTNRCEREICGDGVAVGAEECDDGNVINSDGCSVFCRREYCGDGFLQIPLGEECDDGNAIPEDDCTACVRDPVCGDGILDPHGREECDDGNIVDGDDCDSDCRRGECLAPPSCWTRVEQGKDDSYENSQGNDVAVDSEGNVIVVGSIDDPSSVQGSLLFVRKYNPCGSVLWTDTFDPRPGGLPRSSFDAELGQIDLESGGGGFGADARGVTVDGEGNIYVTGAYSEPGEAFGGGVRGFTTVIHSFTRRYSPEGGVIWTISQRDKSGEDIAADPSGAVYVVGTRWCRDDCPDDGNVRTPWIVKYRPHVGGGPVTVEWEKDYTTGDFSRRLPDDSSYGDARFWGIAIDAGGALYATGEKATPGARNIWLIKYDFDGRKDLSFGVEGELLITSSGISGWNAGYGISLDPLGNPYVAGAMGSSSRPYCRRWSGEECAELAYDQDFWLGKFDPGGAEIWDPAWTFDNLGGNDRVKDIDVDREGNIHLLGQSGIVSGFDLVDGDHRLVRGPIPMTLRIVDLAPDGTENWSDMITATEIDPLFGGFAGPEAGGIAIDPPGNTYVTSSFTASSAFGERNGFLFVRKYAPDGICPAGP